MIKRISITGPESTGKSWLAEQLAGYYQDAWVPEYAREYLAGYKVPRELVIVNELPRVGGWKLLRRELRETYGPE